MYQRGPVTHRDNTRRIRIHEWADGVAWPGRKPGGIQDHKNHTLQASRRYRRLRTRRDVHISSSRVWRTVVKKIFFFDLSAASARQIFLEKLLPRISIF